MYGEGQTRGRVAELGIDAATNQALAALLFNSMNNVLRDYVRLFFEESYLRIRALSFGGVQPNLSLGVIKDTIVPLPPIEEQDEIVRRVDSLMAGSIEILTKVNAASSLLERAGQAALAKALRGELVS